MNVSNLTANSRIYTSNVYLIRGTWNAMTDLNTLVDAGRDPGVIDQIRSAPTGVGKHKLDQIMITHNHYDHTNMVAQLKAAFNSVVYAFSPHVNGVDHLLSDGDRLKMGDQEFEVIHMPGHSQDSVLFYCQAEGVLFAGDTPMVIRSPNGSYDNTFKKKFARICQLNIETIYFGHGDPLQRHCQLVLNNSLYNLNHKGP